MRDDNGLFNDEDIEELIISELCVVGRIVGTWLNVGRV